MGNFQTLQHTAYTVTLKG